MTVGFLVDTNLQNTDDVSLSYRPPDPVSDRMKVVFQVVNCVVLCGVICLFGIGANVVNIVVFIRQGFKDRVNISLFGLAVADLACLVTMFWTSICFNPLFSNSELPFNSIDVMYLTGAWPHAYFNRVTSFITAFITLERCLCIALPLKVKNIITSKRIKVVIISIFIIVLIVFSPVYFVNNLDCVYDDKRNRTIISIVYTEQREIVEKVTFPVHGVAFSVVSLVTVTICTVLLVIKLNEKVKWRKTSSASSTSSSETSTKEKKVVKMITVISTVFIVCFVPATVLFFIMTYDTEFSFSGHYKNIFIVAWTSAFFLETVNSSVNIFIYAKMSSKFRITLVEIFTTNTVCVNCRQ